MITADIIVDRFLPIVAISNTPHYLLVQLRAEKLIEEGSKLLSKDEIESLVKNALSLPNTLTRRTILAATIAILSFRSKEMLQSLQKDHVHELDAWTKTLVGAAIESVPVEVYLTASVSPPISKTFLPAFSPVAPATVKEIRNV